MRFCWKNTGPRESTFIQIANSIKSKDSTKIPNAALAAEAHWLAIGMAGLINVLNPSMVVLGGLLGRVFPYVREQLEREIHQRALASACHHLQLVPSALGSDAPLMGAAELAFEAVLADPMGVVREISAGS